MGKPPQRCEVAEELQTDTRRELERLRVQIQLIRKATSRSLESNALAAKSP